MRPMHCVLALLITAAVATAQPAWSTVKGKVLFDDSMQKAPARVVPPGTKGVQLPNCAAKDAEFLTEEWIVNAKNKGVRNVFVWLAPEPNAAVLKQLQERKLRTFPSFPAAQIHPDLRAVPAKNVEMDQPCCRFIPHAITVRAGQTLVIKNSAEFPHNAKWDSVANGANNVLIASGNSFNLALPKAERAPFDISCRIHPWMKAWVGVFDHPYFATTSADGEFEIKNAPVGKCRLFVWHGATGYLNGQKGRFGQTIEIGKETTELKPLLLGPDEKK